MALYLFLAPDRNRKVVNKGRPEKRMAVVLRDDQSILSVSNRSLPFERYGKT
jgi:hypothetical protein